MGDGEVVTDVLSVSVCDHKCELSVTVKSKEDCRVTG
jgi:hypothetical protein